MSPRVRGIALRATLALLLALGGGCGRNKPGTLLAPTGVSPAPATWTGSITGAVIFDPRNSPDLATAPFPPTRVELFNGATVVAVDSLDPYSQYYRFDQVRPGPYSIVIRSAAFLANSRGGLVVGQGAIDAGNLKLTLDPSVFAASIDVIGTMPGYDEGQLGLGTTSLLENTIGIWTLNNTDYLISPPSPIPAGTYRFKFVKDYVAGSGWGGSVSDTITAPVTLYPCVPASTPATDIVIRFPTTGVYAFTLDERRHRFSVALAMAPASAFARR